MSADEPHPLARVLGAVFMLLTLVVLVGYGLFAAAIRDHVISRSRSADSCAPTFRLRAGARQRPYARPIRSRTRSPAVDG